uniref:Uncharacterized protein n=1 Tax=Lactuca sativa TaxID=4236 RepID=A0A9R1WA08_LACSA|nr:hypothetical protein LSAT_V11C200067490 [Lactuca sativa]
MHAFVGFNLTYQNMQDHVLLEECKGEYLYTTERRSKHLPLYNQLVRFFNTISVSSSNLRNRLHVARVFIKDDVNKCDCDVIPGKEQTCWKLTNPDGHFWYCNNSLLSFDLV